MPFTDRQLEEKIKNAFSSATPDVLGSVMRDIEDQKGLSKVIVMTTTGKKKSFITRAGGIAAVAAIALAVIGGGGYVYSTFYRVASTVSLDVNPSIEIEINKNETVLAVKAGNEDGRTVIGEMDLKGESLEVTVNALVGSLLRNGYLGDDASILISVSTDDIKTGEELRHRLAENVDGALKEESFGGAVVSQNITDDKALRELSEKYEISAGKAQFINNVMDTHPTYSFDDLAPLSVNELTLLLDDTAQPANIETVGKPSETAYIGAEKAADIAFAQVGATSDSVRSLEVDLDREFGVMVYEIEFDYDGYEYSFDINAATGEIVLTGKEHDDDRIYIDDKKSQTTPVAPDTEPVSEPTPNTEPAPEPVPEPVPEPAPEPSAETQNAEKEAIGFEKAKEIAFAHAGVNEADVLIVKSEFDRDDGRQLYEIDFRHSGYEYEYEIGAYDGRILKSETDRDDFDDRYDDIYDDDFGDRYDNGIPAVTPSPKPAPTKPETPSQQPTAVPTTPPATVPEPAPAKPANETLDREAAQDIAFAHAGVSRSDVRELETEFDRDDGRQLYEISFSVGRTEYEYDIDAKTGTILKSEKDYDD